MRILVVGAGATGGFYGGRLAQAGRDVTFLVRPARAETIRRDGLEIVSPLGDATVHPQLVTADDLRSKPESFDLILLATKAYSLASAIDGLAPAVGPETMILPILNGMRQLEMLETRFGKDRVLGGTCRINSDVDAAGRVLQLSTLGELSFGERNGERTPRIERLHSELSGALFDAVLSTNVLATMWHKWCVLASLNIICLLSRGAAGEVVAAPHGIDFAHAAVAECAAILTANGYPPDSAQLAADTRRMTEPGSDLTSSMYRDLKKGAPVEADHVLGDLLDRGAAHHVQAPLLRATYVQLKVYESQRTS